MLGNIDQLKGNPITNPEARNATMKVLVSPTDGWLDYVMRVIEIEPEGYTPKHSHPWPHINYVIEGHGELMMDGKINPVTAGAYAFIPGDTLHQFRNVGKTTFKFICIVPKEGHK